MRLNTIIFARNSLASNIARNLTGERVLDLTETIEGASDNFLIRIFDFSKKLVGFTINVLTNFIQWSFNELWDLLIEAFYEIKYFDWNQTDVALKETLKNNDAIINGALGRLAGTGLVWLSGIAVSASLSFKFPVLAGRIALELAEEGGREIRSALTNLVLTTRNAVIQNVLIGSLLTARRLELFGANPIKRKRKPWSFAEKVEEKINRISSGVLRSFVNGFLDAFEDSVIEMGYVVAFTLDDFYSASRESNNNILGQEQSVIITPNTEVENEQIVVSAPQELVIAETQSVLANHQLVYNRDFGQIVGMPEEDYISPAPQRRKLKVIFYSASKPPWRNPDGTRVKVVECSIPDVKLNLSWQRLKVGIPKFTWGKYRVTAYLDNGRQMTVYGVSYSEAEQQIAKLLELSTANIMNMTKGEPVIETPARRKVPTLVYPVYAKLIKGNVNASGQWINNRRTTDRINLWVDEEPEILPGVL